MTLQERFARNLKRYREELGWSQEQLGSMVGSDRTAISRLERQRGKITLQRADTLATAMKIDVRVLLETPTTAPLRHRPPTDPISTAQIGAKVLELRTAEEISQKTLGSRVGIDRNLISRLEAPGQNQLAPVELSTLEKLATALHVKPTDLL
ncbi:helix-turn-helix transcriptional regulator [Paraburkholderia fungorum]|uniref:helix-turn-helix domain-containing protein n=1 Tax=Paraburkholderia fungorum TaxID=134537 RepID=UPI0038BD4B81